MRGDTSRAPLPNTGTTRKFSVRYWMKTRPCANCSASGGSTISVAGGSFSIATRGEGPRMSRALWAKAAPANIVQAAITVRQLSANCMVFPPGCPLDRLCDLAPEEVPDQRHHFVKSVFKGKVAGVDEVKLDFGQIALVGIRAVGGKDEVVLAPDDQCRRFVLAEISLDRRIERQVGPVVVEHIHLDIVV